MPVLVVRMCSSKLPMSGQFIVALLWLQLPDPDHWCLAWRRASSFSRGELCSPARWLTLCILISAKAPKHPSNMLLPACRTLEAVACAPVQELTAQDGAAERLTASRLRCVAAGSLGPGLAPALLASLEQAPDSCTPSATTCSLTVCAYA